MNIHKFRHGIREVIDGVAAVAVKPLINIPFKNSKTQLLRLLGAKISRTAQVSGSVKAELPNTIEIHGAAEIKDLTVGKNFLHINSNASFSNLNIQKDTFIEGVSRYYGNRCKNPPATFSIDIEGVENRIGENAINAMMQILQKYRIPTTLCFIMNTFYENDDAYKKALAMARANPSIFEVACHGFRHVCASSLDETDCSKECVMMKTAAKKIGFKVSSIAMPYNDVAHPMIYARHSFRKIRGFIGTSMHPFSTKFKNFVFLGTSGFVSPRTAEYHLRRLQEGVHYFTHDTNWTGRLLQFESFARGLRERIDNGFKMKMIRNV